MLDLLGSHTDVNSPGVLRSVLSFSGKREPALKMSMFETDLHHSLTMSTNF